VKASLFASTALTGLVLASPGMAADIPVKMPVKTAVVPPPAFSWTGFYIGANAGYGWGDNATRCSSTDLGSVCDRFPDISSSGFIGGVQVGSNWQSGSFVFGFEGDFNWLDIREATRFPTTFPTIDPGKSDQISARYDWLGTARARAGFAAGQSLFYATGGLAVGRVKSQYIFDVTSSSGPPDHLVFSSSSTRAGWTVGGGGEFALSRNWSVKAEYLHVDLGKTDLDISNHPGIGQATLRFDNKLHIVRGGLNYRF
jgi:outer membrane immunogenic protein